MADNVPITPGSGASIASDDIGGVQYQRVKLALGADGSAVDAVAGAGAVGTSTQRVTLGSDDPAVVAVQVMDDWDESDRCKVNPIVGQAGVAAGAGAVGATTQRATLASDDPAVTALQVIDDWDESDRAKVNPIVGQAGVAAGAGAVGATTQRVTLGSDDPAVTALQIIDDWDNAASDGASVSGDVAHDAADAGEPVKIGGKAATTWPAAVADADRCNALFDKFGRQVVTAVPRDLRGHQHTTITSSTSETTIVTAGGANVFLDLYMLLITNTSGTACTVTIKDSTTGTTRFVFAVPAGQSGGFALPAGDGHKQTTANNNWTATCSASVASIEITAMFTSMANA